MEYPYCTIDGEKYQLYLDDNGVARFPDDGKEIKDLNKFVLDYYNGKRPFKEVFEYYLNSGCSYDLVEGYFSHYGINNHTTTQGNGSTMHFVFYFREDYIIDSGNPDDDRKKAVNYWKKQDNLLEALEMYIMNADADVACEMLNYFGENDEEDDDE